MSEKSVLFLIDTLNTGGAEKSLLDILPRFKKYKPIVCHLYKGDGLKDQYLARGINVTSLNMSASYRFDRGIDEVKKVCTDYKPDIIHSTLFKADIIGRFVKRGIKIPLVNSLVNNSYHEMRFRKADFLLELKIRGVQMIDAFTARWVDLFISNSETIKISNAKALGIPLEKIMVIYRGRDVNDFRQVGNEERRHRKNQLGLDEKKVVLNVSRLLDRKGQLDLIQAFKIAKNSQSNAILIIAGEGPLRTILEEEIKRLNLNDSVKLLGNRMDIPYLLSIADCFAFPSYYEGLPGVLIEAMMAGVPIVASAIPENLECVDETSAWLHSPGDAKGLAREIINVLSSDSAFGKKEIARQSAIKKFEINRIAFQYESVYDQLLQRS